MAYSYSRKLIYIYITKSLGFITGLASVFLVIPALASNPAIFGVYTVCISMTIFFSYADLGFIAAGQKYAAEYFAQQNKQQELKVVGFVIFLLGIFVFISSSGLLLFAFNPNWLIKSSNSYELQVSKKLLLILAISAPIILFQRFNAIIYSIRLDDYIYQLIEIVFNLLKIFSINLFVTSNSYDIVGYYLFIQILSLVSAAIAMLYAIKKYDFTLKETIKNFRFSSEMYHKTKELAFSSLLLTFSWILYFEIDSLLLSKFYGVVIVAKYAIGFSILSFCRNIYNTIYSPFQARFNHFVGLNNDKQLIETLKIVIVNTFPICIFPPIVLIKYMNQVVKTWIGPNYLDSVFIAQMFVLSSAILAIGIPLSYLIIAKSKNKILRLSALCLPIIFF